MFAFAMMAVFTREANADVLTIATWRAILVAVLFGIGALTQGELRLSAQNDDADDKSEKLSSGGHLRSVNQRVTQHSQKGVPLAKMETNQLRPT